MLTHVVVFELDNPSSCLFKANSILYAEFGVGDGMENNTLLLASLGWKGFWVGGEDLVFDYSQNDRFNYTKEWITLDNIIKISRENMKKMNIENLDVISLDLDGNDFHFCESTVIIDLSLILIAAKEPPQTHPRSTPFILLLFVTPFSAAQ